MKDRKTFESRVRLLTEVRNHLAADPRWKEHVKEIDDLILKIREILDIPGFLQDPQLRADLIRLGYLAVSIISMFFNIHG